MDQQRLWHTLSLEDTYAALNSGPRGLGSAEAERRLAEYGPNEIESAHQVSALTILWAQLKNPLVFVLLAAAGISLLAGKTADAIVIAVVILFNTAIGFSKSIAPKRRSNRSRRRPPPRPTCCATALRCETVSS